MLRTPVMSFGLNPPSIYDLETSLGYLHLTSNSTANRNTFRANSYLPIHRSQSNVVEYAIKIHCAPRRLQSIH